MRPALKLCWLLSLSLWLWSAPTHAQESADEVVAAVPAESVEEKDEAAPVAPAPTQPWLAKSANGPAAPDVFLLPDATGKLRKVLGFRYEDFLKAWNHDSAEAAVVPPRYVIDKWNVAGNVGKTHADLRVEFAVTVQVAGWVEVPIQLPEFIVQNFEIEDLAAGECLVFNEQRHGYVVWLFGQPDAKRKLSFTGLAKLRQGTTTPGIELHLPRANSSQFTLRVPSNASRFETSPELTLKKVLLADETNEIRLLGQANPVRLNWTTTKEKTSSQTVLLEVDGQTTVHLDRRRATYRSTLQINSFDSPVEKIRVRLPPRAKLTQSEKQRDYEVREIASADDEDQRQLVEIRLPHARRAPWELTLVAERPIETSGDSAECRVEGFEVLDAFQQSGTVTLEVDDHLQAYFDIHGDIEQTPLEKTTAALEGSSIFGQFRYTRFPWQLVVVTSPRQRRVSVQPKYGLTISSDEALLTVKYQYQLTGAQAFGLRVDLQGWKLTDAPIESGGAVAAESVVVTREGRLVLPLVDSDVQQVNLTLSLRRDVRLGDNAFFLPEPMEAFVVDGELLVNSSESLSVTPKLNEMTGLSVAANTEQPPRTRTGQEPNVAENQIRMRTFLSLPKFAAEVRQRQLQVTADAQTFVDMDQQTIQVRQQLNYLAKYGTVSQLLLNLPEQLWSNDSLQLTLNGEALTFGLGASPIESSSASVAYEYAASEAPTREIIVSLPRPMQNQIQVELAYELSAPELAVNELTTVLLPLAAPQDGLINHQVVVDATSPVALTLNQRSASDEWSVVAQEIATEGAVRTLTLQTSKTASQLSLYAQLESVEKAPLATLERTWIQSWITAGQQQVRAVFRFRTTHSKVFAQLPLALESPELEVLLDGKPWSYELLGNNRLAIAMADSDQRSSHTLELRYYKSSSLPSWGKFQISLPELECRLASAPIYWQLILPQGWQVTESPHHFIPDYWLGWKNYRWGRQPTLSQADLEQITGAVSSAEPTLLSTQYVYRAFEIPTQIQVTVIRQAWVFLAGAFAAFGLGLLWLYTPLLRSGAFWLSLAIILMAGIFSYPEITLLVIEVILAGGLMTYATGVLRRVFIRPAESPAVTTSFQFEPSDITETWQYQRPSDSQTASEATAPLQTDGPSS